MLNVTIYVHYPHSFRYEEYTAIAQTLKQIYGSGNVDYIKEPDIDLINVDDVTLATAKKMADTVKAFHLQYAISNVIAAYYRAKENPALHVEVEVRGRNDTRPDWTRVEVQG